MSAALSKISLPAKARARAAAAAAVDAAPLFTALGDRTRLSLVLRMSEEGPLSIASLTAGTRLSRQGVTKHLRVLADTGVARCERSGREQVWQIEVTRLAEARRWLGQISDQWDLALGRLRTLVERRER